MSDINNINCVQIEQFTLTSEILCEIVAQWMNKVSHKSGELIVQEFGHENRQLEDITFKYITQYDELEFKRIAQQHSEES